MSGGKGTKNFVLLIGRLGADPELKFTPSGAANVNFNLATNRAWKDKDGNKQEKVDWHRIVMWNKTAEIAAEYLKKGSLVCVEGHLETRSYDKDDEMRYITEVVVNDFEMLGNKNED